MTIRELCDYLNDVGARIGFDTDVVLSADDIDAESACEFLALDRLDWTVGA